MAPFLRPETIDKLLNLGVGLSVISAAGVTGGATALFGAGQLVATGVAGLGAIVLGDLIEKHRNEVKKVQQEFEAAVQASQAAWLNAGGDIAKVAGEVAEVLDSWLPTIEIPIGRGRAFADALGQGHDLYVQVADEMLRHLSDPCKLISTELHRQIAKDVLAQGIRSGVLASSSISSDTILAAINATARIGNATLVAVQAESIASAARDSKILEGQAQLAESFAALMQVAKDSGSFERAQEKGIPESVVRKLVERLGGEGVAQENLVEWLEVCFTEIQSELVRLRDLVERGSSQDEKITIAIAHAAQVFSINPFEAAKPLEDLILMRKAEQATRAMREQAETLALYDEAIRLKTITFDIAGAARLTLALADEPGQLTGGTQGEFLHSRALAALTRGKDRGDNAHLLLGISLLESMLASTKREVMPSLWAKAQRTLANGLAALGERESGSDRLEQAVQSYLKALEEYSPTTTPSDWALTQNNLGNALSVLSDRQREATHLGKSIIAFRRALGVFSRDRFPLDWAMVQNNMGNALQKLGRGDVGTELLEQAALAYRSAIEIYTPDHYPTDWAMAQNNLGIVNSLIGERSNDIEQLKLAVSAYKSALKKYSHEKNPVQWASAQLNLGTALSLLGERDTQENYRGEALRAFSSALKVYTRNESPLQWALIKNNLGILHWSIGKSENDDASLELAVLSFGEALEERTRESVPLAWAETQHNLGNALSSLGLKEEGSKQLEAAVLAYNCALLERTQTRVPVLWADTQNNLGNALVNLSIKKRDVDLLQKSIAALEAALTVRTPDRQLEWAVSFSSLSKAQCLAAANKRSESGVRAALGGAKLARDTLLNCAHQGFLEFANVNLAVCERLLKDMQIK